MNTRILLSATIVIAALCLTPAYAQHPPTDVYLIGTLYKRHEQVPAFDVAVLRRIIADVRPDVMVLDVSPEELKKNSVHASKVEYTQTVVPMIATGIYAVYPAEPAEPMFSEIVQGLSAHLREYAKQQPVLAAAFNKNEQALYAVLKPYWTSASRVQDEVTAGAIGASAGLQGELVGPVLKSADARWDRHTADAVIKAVNEHPGKRVLVLTGIRNRPTVKLHLAAEPTIRLVDMPTWLAKAGY